MNGSVDSKRLKLNNEGYSLVELLVAISIGVIVAAAVTGLISFAIRMYQTEKIKTGMQYEIQTTLNQTVDSILSAQWFALNSDTVTDAEGISHDRTSYIALGKLEKSGSGDYVFKGEIYAAGDVDPVTKRFNIYMNRYNNSPLNVGDIIQSSDPSNAGNPNNTEKKIEAEAASIKGQEEYLLGKDAINFLIKADDTNNFKLEQVDGNDVRSYSNPIGFDIEIEFERNSYSGDNRKLKVNDKAVLRNYVKLPVYIGGKGYYELSE